MDSDRHLLRRQSEAFGNDLDRNANPLSDPGLGAADQNQWRHDLVPMSMYGYVCTAVPLEANVVCSPVRDTPCWRRCGVHRNRISEADADGRVSRREPAVVDQPEDQVWRSGDFEAVGCWVSQVQVEARGERLSVE